MNESGISLFEAATYEDLIGKNIYDQLHPCDHEDVKRESETSPSKNRVRNCQAILVHLPEQGHLYGDGLHSDDLFGEAAVQVILRDISERKQTEELMLKSENYQSQVSLRRNRP